MNKKYVPFIVLFAVLLVVPFTVQTVADLRGERRFVSLDIFKDLVYTPFKRESSMNSGAQKLDSAWRSARESVAAGEDVSDALEPAIAALSDLEATTLTVNGYAELDSAEPDYKLLKSADTLLSALEDDPESFPKVDSVLKSVVDQFRGFSMARVFHGVKHYGIWQGKYLRAFEHKVENENALVLAARPVYQLAVWKIFSDPGEKVVLGKNPSRSSSFSDSLSSRSCARNDSCPRHSPLSSRHDVRDFSARSCARNDSCPRHSPLSSLVSRLSSDKWLFYRQDVEFLVNPSPFDVRSAKLDNPLTAIAKFRDQLKAKGVELLVVVVPGKPSIYPERLTGNSQTVASQTAPKFGHGKAVLDTLAALGFHTVDLYSPLWSAKVDDDSLGALYLNDDTHWTPRGAELAAGVIAAKVLQMADSGVVDVGEASMDYVASDSLADRMGDIGEMSGLNKHNVFKVQQVVGHVVSDSTGAPFKDDFRKAKILILGDSFSRIYQTDSPVNAGWIAHFAKELQRPVASIVSDGGASTLVREKLARKANVLKGKKLLIWEFVERDLRYGAEGWKTVEF